MNDYVTVTYKIVFTIHCLNAVSNYCFKGNMKDFMTR